MAPKCVEVYLGCNLEFFLEIETSPGFAKLLGENWI